MLSGLRTCLHLLHALHYRQVRNRFYRQSGDHHYAIELLLPSWMFPNIRRTTQNDTVDANVVPDIIRATNELHRQIDPLIDDENELSDSRLALPCHPRTTAATTKQFRHIWTGRPL